MMTQNKTTHFGYMSQNLTRLDLYLWTSHQLKERRSNMKDIAFINSHIK
jgi:hypothetical protein